MFNFSKRTRKIDLSALQFLTDEDLTTNIITLEEMITKYDDIETYVLGLPMIGCGIGKGDYSVVKEILEASSIKIIVVEYDNRDLQLCQGEINFPS